MSSSAGSTTSVWFSPWTLVQELRHHQPGPKREASDADLKPSSTTGTTTDPVWVLKFSRDGRYLASGGQDGTIRGNLTCWRVSGVETLTAQFNKSGVLRTMLLYRICNLCAQSLRGAGWTFRKGRPVEKQYSRSTLALRRARSSLFHRRSHQRVWRRQRFHRRWAPI